MIHSTIRLVSRIFSFLQLLRVSQAMENSSLPLGCSPTADAAFGPIVHSCRSDFDFTITFEQYFFTLVPASALLIAAPFRLRHLSKRPATVADNPFRLIKLVSTDRMRPRTLVSKEYSSVVRN